MDEVVYRFRSINSVLAADDLDNTDKDKGKCWDGDKILWERFFEDYFRCLNQIWYKKLISDLPDR